MHTFLKAAAKFYRTINSGCWKYETGNAYALVVKYLLRDEFRRWIYIALLKDCVVCLITGRGESFGERSNIWELTHFL